MKKWMGFILIIVMGLFLQACAKGTPTISPEQKTVNALQVQLAVEQTRNAEIQITQVFMSQQSTVVPPTEVPAPPASPTLEPVPDTATPQPAPTTAAPAPTEPPQVTPTVAEPTITPTTKNTSVPSTATADKFQERVRVENRSGQDFKIKLACSGGPCQEHSNTSYSNTFPTGVFYFYVYPGRYKITWTICGKTETFEHVLNGGWYIHLAKCK